MKMPHSTLEEINEKLTKLNKRNIEEINRLKRLQKEKAKEFEEEVKKTTATAIAYAFSFTIALFWRDAIQELITKLLESLGFTESGYIAKLIAALLVTIIGVFAIMKISKWGEVNKSKLPI